MSEMILGARVRELRRQIKMTQTELARRLGISASYLNLIERNKRRIAGQLLVRTAGELGVSVDDLDGAHQQQLAGKLHEIARLPNVSTHAAETDDIGELIGRFPGWAKAIEALARSERQANTTARALADRLTHDPYLSDAMHRMLTRISAVRSAAEIVTDFDDISVEQRQRFLSIINDESHILSNVGEALAAYFDKLKETERHLTPQDEVEAFFQSNGFRFDAIETAAKTENLQVSGSNGAGRGNDSLSPGAADLPPSMAGMIDRIVNAAPELETKAGRARAQLALVEYALEAARLTAEELTSHAADTRYDIEVIASRLNVPFGMVCRRLTALPQNAGHPVFSYFQANAAGSITKASLNTRDLPVPRYSSACPLWALYRAQQIPATALCQRVELPTGTRFVFVAKAENRGETGHQQPKHFVTDMAVIAEADADMTVYQPISDARLEPIGLACRICTRPDCRYRIDDPLA